MLLSCDRFAPLRFYTRGYTGAKKSNQRDRYVFVLESLSRAIETIRKLIETDLKLLDPLEFTHFVRGELFVILDSALTSHFNAKKTTYSHFPLPAVEAILALSDAYLQLYCKWLKRLPELVSAV